MRLNTLNYCPMACTFCSSTNFLHSAQGSVAKVARLTAAECMAMVRRVVADQPKVRTIIFQDDIFVFTNDNRITELCDLILKAKAAGALPKFLEFISTNRIDAMTPDRLTLMKRSGFRVVGFGVESFSEPVLREFNKAHIYKHIEPVLSTSLRLGMTPFLDLILSSPRSSLDDVAETIRRAYRWIMAGCEVGLYPYVVPFSGSRMADDPDLEPYTTTKHQAIAGTDIGWEQPEHILPADAQTRSVLRQITDSYEESFPELSESFAHIPSRARSLLWVAAAIPVLRAAGAPVPGVDGVKRKLERELSRAERPESVKVPAARRKRVA